MLPDQTVTISWINSIKTPLLCKAGEILKFTAIEGKKMSKSGDGGNQTFLNNYPAVSGSMYNVMQPGLAAAAVWSDI